MHASRRLALIVLPAASLLGCLENEEEIVIHPDGSVQVTVSASGGVGDLASGYAVPLDVAWRPASAETEHWLAEVGATTGGAHVEERVRQVTWPDDPGDGEEPTTQLSVEHTFASIEDWPRFFAPADEPYRTAYLERSAELEIREVDGRRVYSFERTYHGRDSGRLDPFGIFDDAAPEEIRKKLDAKERLTPADWDVIVPIVRSGHCSVAERYVRDAAEGIYTRGDAALPVATLDGIHGEVRRRVEQLITRGRLADLYAILLADGDEGARALDDLEREFRITIRTALGEALVHAEVAEETRNAVLFALEWGFTATDHAGDLQDEGFTVVVQMPGRLVGGNFAEAKDSGAAWHFDGKDLDRDVVLRVVSVLE